MGRDRDCHHDPTCGRIWGVRIMAVLEPWRSGEELELEYTRYGCIFLQG